MLRLQTFFVVLISVLLPCLLYSQNNRITLFNVQPGKEHVVLIQWKAAPASDTLPFEIERSKDTINWEKIFQTGVASSHEYFFIDTMNGSGLFYYRIGQTDIKGHTFYSLYRWVQISKSGPLYIWPNPANDVLHIRTPFAKGSMEIYDSGGKLMLKRSITNNITNLPLLSFGKGIYFIRAKHDKEILAEKFVKE